VADPANPPPGCHFHPRCRYAQERCRVEAPALEPIDGNWVACHRARELSLQGVR
jgi:peptide/nickel transport system ATP-binding protein